MTAQVVECPICFNKVTKDFINVHLDSNCTKFAAKRTKTSQNARQSTLTKFMGLSSDHLPLQYFCLELTADSGMALEKFNCVLHRDLPAGYKVLFEFKCKSFKQPLYLCSNASAEFIEATPKTVASWFNDDSVFTYPTDQRKSGSEEEYRNISAMKSHLQKAIRRGMSYQAVHAALHMMQMPPRTVGENRENIDEKSSPFDGIIQLSRRLLIIQLEDVMLSKYCPLITWIMVYFSKLDGLLKKHPTELKSRLFSKRILHYFCVVLLEFAEHLSAWSKRDSPPNSFPSTKMSLEHLNMHENHLERTMLYCLGIRADYGGMSCDVELLHQSSHQWYSRFNSKSYTVLQPASFQKNDKLQHAVRLVEKLEHGQLVSLPRSEWVLAAIDFHVSPIAQKLQSQMNPVDLHKLCDLYDASSDIDAVKSWMWDNSSSVNWRVPIVVPSKSSTIWSKYESIFKQSALEFIKNSC